MNIAYGIRWDDGKRIRLAAFLAAAVVAAALLALASMGRQDAGPLTAVMGCEMGQGYYFTKPLEPEALQLLRAYGRENLAAAWAQAFDSVLPQVQDASLRGLQGA